MRLENIEQSYVYEKDLIASILWTPNVNEYNKNVQDHSELQIALFYFAALPIECWSKAGLRFACSLSRLFLKYEIISYVNG